MASSNKIPWELYLQIQEALELRELVEHNKNDHKLKKESKDKNDSESDSDSEDENGHDVELELCEDRLRDLAKAFKKMKHMFKMEGRNNRMLQEKHKSSANKKQNDEFLKLILLVY